MKMMMRRRRTMGRRRRRRRIDVCKSVKGADRSYLSFLPTSSKR
jgi:hypothetical protein